MFKHFSGRFSVAPSVATQPAAPRPRSHTSRSFTRRQHPPTILDLLLRCRKRFNATVASWRLQGTKWVSCNVPWNLDSNVNIFSCFQPITWGRTMVTESHCEENKFWGQRLMVKEKVLTGSRNILLDNSVIRVKEICLVSTVHYRLILISNEYWAWKRPLHLRRIALIY